MEGLGIIGIHTYQDKCDISMSYGGGGKDRGQVRGSSEGS